MALDWMNFYKLTRKAYKMETQKLIKEFEELQTKLYAYGHAMMLLNWDGSTFAPITYSSTSHKGPETCNMVKADTKNKRLVSIGWRKPLKLGQ